MNLFTSNEENSFEHCDLNVKSTESVVKLLRAYNVWRRCEGPSKMFNPTSVGLAIDALCDRVEFLETQLTDVLKQSY